jgi:hypothetical protein
MAAGLAAVLEGLERRVAADGCIGESTMVRTTEVESHRP